MTSRLDQLLGVTGLAVCERLRDAVGVAGVGEVEAGALIHLQAWPGTSIGGLTGVVGRSQPATVRLVDRLVEIGLVRRQPGPDRRTVALVLTDAGSRVVESVLTARADALAPLLADLSPVERTRLEALLGRITSGLAEDHPTALHVCRLCDRDACCAPPGCPLQHTAP